MRRLALRGPLFTLLAALAVGVGLFAVNTAFTGTPAGLSTAAQAQQAAPAQDAQAPAEAAGSGDDYGADEYGAAAPADEAAPEAESTGAAGAQPQTGEPAATGIAYAGRSAGNEVTIALGVGGTANGGPANSPENSKVVAYVCDGEKIESWLEGSLTGTSLRLTGPDGTELTADVSQTAVLGSVAVAGKSWPFSAQPEQGASTDRAALRALGRA